MPNISAHMIVAKEVSKILNINSDDFIKGNLLPDIIDLENSHHKILYDDYLIPDIDYFVDRIDFDNDLYIGYLTHLLLDKHYLIDYIKVLYSKTNVFSNGIIYDDYNFLNVLLVDKFELDIDYLVNVLSNYDCKILEKKLKYNIEYLKQRTNGNPRYLDFESFSQFLLDVSNVISKELVYYANKRGKLFIRVRE